MNISLLFLFFTISVTTFCQAEKHKSVNGTKISMIPPKGFEAAKGFSGFQNDELGASIMIIEIPGDYESSIKGFTVEDLRSKGMTLIDKQTIDFRNSKATFVKLSQKANGVTYLKQILVFGDSTKTVMVNGIYPEDAKTIEKDIKASLLSVSYNAGLVTNQEDAVKFKVDLSGTPFKITKGITGSLTYTTDGEIPTRAADKAWVTVISSAGKPATGDKKEFAIAVMKRLPRVETIEVKETNPVKANDLSGFEVVGYGDDAAGIKQIVYLLVLYTADEFYMINGRAIDKFDSYLADFRKIGMTFKLK